MRKWITVTLTEFTALRDANKLETITRTPMGWPEVGVMTADGRVTCVMKEKSDAEAPPTPRPAAA